MSKFWRKNEKKLMKGMGLKPTFGSGNTFIEKEDGESEYFLAQAKSTKAQSITLQKRDVKLLFENAAMLGKCPVFVLDFVGGDMPLKLLAFDYEDAIGFLG